LVPRAPLVALSTVLLIACDPPPLEPRHKVSSPRVLAIIAEPPEVRPGGLVDLHLITGGITGTPSYSWSACARPESTATFAAQSTFGQAEPNDACFGDAGASVIRLPFTGPTALIAIPADLLVRLDALRAVYGSNISSAQLYQLARTAGLPLTIAVEVRAAGPDGGMFVERALKRVVVVDREERNHNPPPPSFTFGFVARDGGTVADAGSAAGSLGIPMRYVPGSDDRCEPADNAGPIVVRPEQVFEIAPDPTEGPWLERYFVLDAYGRPAQQTETAFYSWYSTGGAYRDDRTRIPTRNTIWEAPQRLGPITHWLIVRDGRGGTSGCRYTVEVSRDAGVRMASTASDTALTDATDDADSSADAGAHSDGGIDSSIDR
jgi:hypothetical protein